MRFDGRHSTSRPARAHRHLTLHLPGLFDVGRVLLEDLANQAPALPGLERILSRGGAAGGLPDSIRPPSAAALGLLGERMEPGGYYWLRADPVHLHPDQDFLLLWDAAALSLSQPETDALVATFNAHFAEDGIELIAPAPDRWYLRMPESLDVATRTPGEVTGRNIGHFMPRGPDATRLEQFINEVQMLFHDHPVNRERSQSGRPAVSSVWPWGGGVLTETPADAPSEETHQTVLARDPVLLGLARHQGRESGPIPASFEDWLSADIPDALIQLEQGSMAAREGDGPGWQAALEALDRDWWLPAVRALGRGRLAELVLWSESLGGYRLTRGLNRRFWRRRQRLPDVLARLAQAEEANR